VCGICFQIESVCWILIPEWTLEQNQFKCIVCSSYVSREVDQILAHILGYFSPSAATSNKAANKESLVGVQSSNALDGGQLHVVSSGRLTWLQTREKKLGDGS
jgi:hypothetical protein